MRKDRVNKHGGGILTYVHSNLNYSVINDLADPLLEAHCLKIHQPCGKPFLTATISCLPNSPKIWVNYFSKYINKCKDVCVCDDIILCGDFNINLNTTQTKWLTTTAELNLLQLIKDATRVPILNRSLIRDKAHQHSRLWP